MGQLVFTIPVPDGMETQITNVVQAVYGKLINRVVGQFIREVYSAAVIKNAMNNAQANATSQTDAVIIGD